MSLHPVADPSAVAWLRGTADPWRLITLGPDGYPAYARLRFIPDPTFAGQHEADADVPEDHVGDLAQGRHALAVLAASTTSTRYRFLAWDGWGTLPFPADVVVSEGGTEIRRYALLEGDLADLAEWDAVVGGGRPPAFTWPLDRAWVLTCDVDPHFAGVAGSEAAVAALVATPGLDVVRADPRDALPSYRA